MTFQSLAVAGAVWGWNILGSVQLLVSNKWCMGVLLLLLFFFFLKLKHGIIPGTTKRKNSFAMQALVHRWWKWIAISGDCTEKYSFTAESLSNSVILFVSIVVSLKINRRQSIWSNVCIFSLHPCARKHRGMHRDLCLSACCLVDWKKTDSLFYFIWTSYEHIYAFLCISHWAKWGAVK